MDEPIMLPPMPDPWNFTRPIVEGYARLAVEQNTEALRAECDALRAELDRLTTLRPASEWDGETYVLWWREWDVAGWALDSISDSQESFYWTPAFDAHLPRAGGCANSLGDGVVAPSLEPAHPIPTPTEPT